MASQTGKAKHAQTEWLAAQEKLRAAQQKVDANAKLERCLEQEGAELVSSRLRYEYILKNLESLGTKIFTGFAVQTFPVLEALQWEVDVKETELELLPIELDREKRARQVLKSAEQCIKDCLKYVRTILNIGIEMGVPQDNKHHQKLFSGSAQKFADSSMPSMLNCKSSLGKYVTLIVQARMRLDLILVSPQFELPDLTRLPGRKKVGTMTELEMYSAMERCYAQCQACCTYVATEICVSVAREKAYRQKLGNYQEALKTGKANVQRAQYTILNTYNEGLAEVQRQLRLQFPLAASQLAEIARAKQLEREEGSSLRPGSQLYQTTDSNSVTSETSYTRVVTAKTGRPVGMSMIANATNRGTATTSQEASGVQGSLQDSVPAPWWQERRFPYLFPPSQFPLNLPPPMRLNKIPWLERWRFRWHNLSQLSDQMKYNQQDKQTYPELDWDANVRCSPDLHPEEEAFIAKRRRLISSEGDNSLARFLQLPEDTYVHPDDVPLIAIGGSGGGYRAMFAYAGFIKEAENTGLWQCTTWVSGVSGSCWTVAALYAIASCSTDVLIAHLLAMAHEGAHPMSIQAMDRIARSRNGIFYLLGPLLRKSSARNVKCRLMDFYATLTLSYMYLPRPLALFGTNYSYKGPTESSVNAPDGYKPLENTDYKPGEGLSRETFQWSQVWKRAKLDRAQAPLPILTGVRRVWRPRPKHGNLEPPSRVEQPPAPHPAAIADGTAAQAPAYEPKLLVGGGYDWYEISPLELGSRNTGAWIPTWGYGRRFENGQSTERQPEVSLSMIVGQCTGAPAGPLTAYISTMLASIPEGTVMSTLLSYVNEFMKMKRWEKRWGNPIRAADEPNPFYGHGMDDRVISMPDEKQTAPAKPETEPILRSSAKTRSTARRNPVEEPYHQDDRVAPAPAIMTASDSSEGQRPGIDQAEQSSSILELTQAPIAELGAPIRKIGVVNTPSSFSDSYYKPDPAQSRLNSISEKTTSHDLQPSSQMPVDLQEKNEDAPEVEAPQQFSSAPFFSKLPHLSLPNLPKMPEVSIAGVNRLGEINFENPLRLQRRRSDASITSSVSDYDPDLFMAPLDDGSSYANRQKQDAEPSRAKTSTNHSYTWEHSKKLRLMDSGLSNNLPNHVLSRAERNADILISFDSSSDVKIGAAVERIHEFASDCGLEVELDAKTRATNEAAIKAAKSNEESAKQKPPSQPTTSDDFREEAERIRNEFEPRIAQRFDGWRLSKGGRQGRSPDVRLVYCPLFPNAVQPGFDPSTANYSTSYNLVWTADQVRALLRTAMANVEEGSYGIEVIRAAVRESYEARRLARLAREAMS
ncbi:phospholipase A2 [Malassezia yamatoensis]|uniref:Lysophospholipase n=1 Tax=Malassezia yamatoensis TaxID=253288 RepID=A0AAJ6CIL4_9BASI|nr:phospholipase A2 [Malassezia yamatoensis]